ncbi:MAG: ATP-binding protein [Pirellulaceae bacterium]
MSVSEAMPRSYQTTDVDALIRLFRAFRDRNDALFRKIAESIIADQLAGNHHALAKELKSALGPNLPRGASQLSTLPRDKRSGADLVTIIHEPASTEHLVLDPVAQERINRVVDERRNASKLARYGYAPKSKLLFWGPPGCGKTLTAHYLANQFNLKVGLVRLSAIISSYLGDTAAHLQQVFDLAQESPMVILFDEIDSISKSRDDSNDVGEIKRVVNSLLQAMDSFSPKESILIGASNHQYLLDPAIWRRFDDVIVFPKPTPALREHYIGHQLNGLSFKGTIDSLAKLTSG